MAYPTDASTAAAPPCQAPACPGVLAGSTGGGLWCTKCGKEGARPIHEWLDDLLVPLPEGFVQTPQGPVHRSRISYTEIFTPADPSVDSPGA